MHPPLIVCIGGAHLDRRGILRAPLVLGTSNPGAIRTDLGGVARNVAQNLANLGCRVLLCSRVGNDEAGRQVLSQPLDTSLVTVSDSRPTASYTAILGALIANPVDAADEIPAAEMSGSIEGAVAEAAVRGIRGKAVTPYILARLTVTTGGRSLRANIALVRSNARLAAELAAAWAS